MLAPDQIVSGRGVPPRCFVSSLGQSPQRAQLSRSTRRATLLCRAARFTALRHFFGPRSIYAFGILAMNVGNAWRNHHAACRRACVSASQSETGRNGVSCAMDSSVAKISIAVARYFSAFLRPSVAIRHSTWTRNNTSSADTGGKAPGSAFSRSGTGNAILPTQTRDHAQALGERGLKAHAFPAFTVGESRGGREAFAMSGCTHFEGAR